MASLSLQQLMVLVLASEIIDERVVEACGALLQSKARMNTAMLRRLQEGGITTERGMQLSTRVGEAIDAIEFAWDTYKTTRDSGPFVKALAVESKALAELATELSD